MMKKYLTSVLAVAIMMTSACGGGGTTTSSATGDTGGTGDTSVPGITIADQMSLVTADSSTSSSLSRLLMTSWPAGSDAANAEPSIYVYDDSMEALDFVNELLCFFNQTHSEDYVNVGPHIVLVNETLCSGDHGGSDSSNPSSGMTDSFMPWVVDATRVDEFSPQINRVWIPENEMGGYIHGELTIDSGITNTNSFGVWRLHYALFASEPALFPDAPELFHGVVDVGQNADGDTTVQINTVEEDGTRLVNAVFNSTSGQAHIEEDDIYYGPMSMDIAFNDAFYRVLDLDGESCLDRVNLESNVWGYNAYTVNGESPDINSGESFRYHEFYGYASYYGVWLEDGSGIADGDFVTLGYDTTEVQKRYRQKPGRLTRRTRHTMPINDIIGQTFFSYDDVAGEVIHVRLDATQSDIIHVVKTDIEVCNDSGCSREPVNPEVTLAYEPGYWVNLWKDSTSYTIVTDADGYIRRSMEVPYYTTEPVLPSGNDLDLECIFNCLKYDVTGAEMDSGDIFLPNDDWENPITYPAYFSGADYVMTYNGQELVPGAGETPSVGSIYEWGMQGGPYFPAGTVLTDAGAVWDLAEVYYWETGTNPWNWLTYLEETSYDKPYDCLLRDAVAGTFPVQYGGEGELWGLPYEQVGDSDRWVATVTIPDFSELECTEGTLYTKQMNVELLMPEVDAANCSGLSVVGLGAPTVTYVEPNIGDDPCADGSCPTY